MIIFILSDIMATTPKIIPHPKVDWNQSSSFMTGTDDVIRNIARQEV